MTESSICDIYQSRADFNTQMAKACAKRGNLFAWLRFLCIVAFLAGTISLYSISALLSAMAACLSAIVFAFCVKRHLAIGEQQAQFERLSSINMNEKACLEGDLSPFDAGSRYADTKHFYSGDLDIFGEHSVFRYLNRTTSPSGSDLLAYRLSHAATTPEIRARQAAVDELAPLVDLRQAMQALGLKYRNIANDLPTFLAWLKADAELSLRKGLLRTLNVLPCLTIAAIVASSIGWIPSVAAWLPVAVHLVISYRYAATVNRLHQQVSHKVDFIATYSGLIRILCSTTFKSPKMQALRECFDRNEALRQVKALKRRIAKLDYRLNMLFIPVNILFFFDFKHLVWLEHWRASHRQNVAEWFAAIAEAETLSSFANAVYNNPVGWSMPEITDEYFHFEAQALGHPLIPASERVCNDFSIVGSGQIAVITGSNMSGKSTFERSIGVNMALALAGAPVCAARLKVSNCLLFTYMRIADNLEERTSSFYAELKRLKQLIDLTKTEQRVFFLLDEVLRGTNSRDRQTGSMALVRQLARQQATGVIATHDIALSELERELPAQVRNAHFDVQINGDDMAFDYRLHTGVCTSMNASLLMKKIGVEVDS